MVAYVWTVCVGLGGSDNWGIKNLTLENAKLLGLHMKICGLKNRSQMDLNQNLHLKTHSSI